MMVLWSFNESPNKTLEFNVQNTFNRVKIQKKIRFHSVIVQWERLAALETDGEHAHLSIYLYLNTVLYPVHLGRSHAQQFSNLLLRCSMLHF